MRMKIGFEIHEQLATKRKLCCDCPTDYREAPPNTNVCPICTAMPGAKPMPPNVRAVDAVIEVALMLGCDVVIDQPIYIQRKHYDYPDLPAGYQHSSTPIGINGELVGVRIREVHLEEDPGAYDPVAGTVDFNRCGIPLVEIVTEPDMHSPEEARRFLRQLMLVLDYSGKVRPEPGTLRADTNISLEGGTRVEIKNINSTKGAYRAVKFEVMRQKALIERGAVIPYETRAYLESQMITIPMRMKVVDFRVIPDPDIFPIIIDRAHVETIRRRMVEVPHLREQRLAKQYQISQAVAGVIVSERELADLFEAVAKRIDPKLAATWFRTRLKKVLNYMKLRAADVKFTAKQLADLLQMIKLHEITPEQGELALRELVREPDEPKKIIQKLKLRHISSKKLESIVSKLVYQDKKAKAVQDIVYRNKSEAFHFLTGKIMQLTMGQADPRQVGDFLNEKIAGLQYYLSEYPKAEVRDYVMSTMPDFIVFEPNQITIVEVKLATKRVNIDTLCKRMMNFKKRFLKSQKFKKYREKPLNLLLVLIAPKRDPNIEKIAKQHDIKIVYHWPKWTQNRFE